MYFFRRLQFLHSLCHYLEGIICIFSMLQFGQNSRALCTNMVAMKTKMDLPCFALLLAGQATKTLALREAR